MPSPPFSLKSFLSTTCCFCILLLRCFCLLTFSIIKHVTEQNSKQFDCLYLFFHKSYLQKCSWCQKSFFCKKKFYNHSNERCFLSAQFIRCYMLYFSLSTAPNKHFSVICHKQKNENERKYKTMRCTKKSKLKGLKYCLFCLSLCLILLLGLCSCGNTSGKDSVPKSESLQKTQ